MRKFFTLFLLIALVAIPVLAIDTDDEHPVLVFDDGRINNFDAAAPVAVFGTDFAGGRGLEMWAPIGFEGAGVMVLRVTPEQIAAVSATPRESTLIAAAEDNSVALYRLPTGEFQLWARTNKVEWYILTFETLGQNTGYVSEINKAA
jgi:hypothetical protein